MKFVATQMCRGHSKKTTKKNFKGAITQFLKQIEEIYNFLMATESLNPKLGM